MAYIQCTSFGSLNKNVGLVCAQVHSVFKVNLFVCLHLLMQIDQVHLFSDISRYSPPHLDACLQATVGQDHVHQKK